MENKQRKKLIRIIISFVMLLTLLLLSRFITNWYITLFLYFSLYIYIGHDILKKCFKNIRYGNILDENLLMVIATIGAFGLGIYNSINNHIYEGFEEGVAVMLFYQIGEWFQDYALGKSRKSITELMNLKPEFANLISDNGVKLVDPNNVNVGDIILVNPGEKVPLDGIVISGSSLLDLKSLNGESTPISIKEDDEVLSGSINLTNSIKIQVNKSFENSTISKILDLIENAPSNKSNKENFITKFAKYYTPIIVISSLLLFIIGSIITKNTYMWLYRALSFLVVSCPCALVISIPLSFFGGIGCASKNGILIKGSNYLELLNKANIFVFDKTGTLTKGNFDILKVVAIDGNEEELIRLAKIAESNSNHPIAKSIKQYKDILIDESYNIKDISGKGIIATKNNEEILVGNSKLMDEYNISYNKVDEVSSVIYVAYNRIYKGYILIGDQIKEESYNIIEYLNKDYKTIMLTGDNEKVASYVANNLNINTYYSSLLPFDKARMVDNLLSNKKEDDVVVFIGDGLNDAPVLTRADIGISMGNIGSDAAIEASDIVLTNDNLSNIKLSKKIAFKTMRIVNENIIFSISIKVLILLLSAIGKCDMWLSIFGDVGVSILAILNSFRASKIKDED